MTELASPHQLRMSFTRWALVMVPLLILLGALSGIIAGPGDQNHWYSMLEKPAYMPAGKSFAVVWTVLYALMGFAVALILDARRARGKALALSFFFIQLMLNLAWSPVFFLRHKVHFAVFLLLMIVVMACATIWLFSRIRARAAWLMLPYLLWLCFAGVLAYQMDRLNPNAAALGTLAGHVAIQ